MRKTSREYWSPASIFRGWVVSTVEGSSVLVAHVYSNWLKQAMHQVYGSSMSCVLQLGSSVLSLDDWSQSLIVYSTHSLQRWLRETGDRWIRRRGLCMGPSHWINKVLAVVHSLVGISWQGTDVVVRSPFVWDDGGSWEDVLLDDWKQCMLAPVFNLHHESPTCASTQCPSTTLPRLYFLLPNFDSSISTILLGPPIVTGWSKKYCPHTSLQKLYQERIKGEGAYVLRMRNGNIEK